MGLQACRARTRRRRRRRRTQPSDEFVRYTCERASERAHLALGLFAAGMMTSFGRYPYKKSDLYLI
uniref:Uncharacterized protein n=1 Tax=Oryza rufipogon TaxID=4529 RepID=A0A0E0N2P8_ORYRU